MKDETLAKHHKMPGRGATVSGLDTTLIGLKTNCKANVQGFAYDFAVFVFEKVCVVMFVVTSDTHCSQKPFKLKSLAIVRFNDLLDV